MKKPNFDFSKEGLKRFFLYHAEKVILVVAIVLTGLFFWLGFKTDVFSEKAPAELSQMADRARDYIVSNTSWDNLKEFRKGDDTVDVRIRNSNDRVNLSQLLPNYADGLIMGVPERTLAKRADPEIVLPTELVARSFRASILFQIPPDRYLDGLPIAGTATDEDEDDKHKSRKRDEELALGTEVPEYVSIEMNGVRPKDAGVSSGRAMVRDVNVLTGVIDMDAQWKNFEPLKNSMGYYPPRDKPNYRYLQVERWDSDSKEWKDITKNVERYQKYFVGNFPQLTPEGDRRILDGADGSAAPEIVAPEHYDPALTAPIPSFIQFDYTQYALHPGPSQSEIKMRTVADLAGLANEQDEVKDEGDPFDFNNNAATPQDQKRDKRDDKSNRQKQNKAKRSGELQQPRKGSDDLAKYARMATTAKKQTSHKLIRFFDILDEDVTPGTSFKYRVKVWLDDPNNEKERVVEKRGSSQRKGDNLKIGGNTGGTSGMEREDGGSSGTRGGGSDLPAEETYTYVKAEDSMKLESVRERVNKARDKTLPKELEILAHARTATDENGEELWSEESNAVVVGENSVNAYVYAGQIDSPRIYKIDDDRAVAAEERAAMVAIKSWHSENDGAKNKLGVPVPGMQTTTHVSEVLDFVTNAHILHPVDWTIRLAEDTTIRSSNMVVDLMGGDEIRKLGSRSGGAILYSMKYATPSEMLVMDFDKMEFTVRNDIDDKGDFLQTLMLPDETSAIGGRKAKKTDDDDDDDKGDRRGGRGGDNPFGN